MAKDTVDLYAESDRGIISDDTAQSLRLENSSSGAVLLLKQAGGNVTTTANAVALRAQLPATAAPTVAVIQTLNSVASGAHFEFQGFLASTASMGSIVRGVRVKFGDNYGWVPIYASATFI